MDLISREAVLDGIDKYIEKAQSTGTKDDFISFAELGVKALPSAFEGMTYGEVFETIFPNLVFQKTQDEDSGKKSVLVWTGENILFEFDLDIWDSPYKVVSE